MDGSIEWKKMAEVSRGWAAVSCISVLIGVFAIFGTDTGDMLWRFGLKSLFCLAILSFLVTTLYPRLQKFLSRYKKQKDPEPSPVSEFYYQNLRDQARDQLQKEHSTKASSYNERILRPRQEARLKQKEEDFRRNMGPAWKGKGHKLGRGTEEDEEPVVSKTRKGPGGSKEAATARRLPEPESDANSEPGASPSPPEVIPLVRKMVVELPSEPPADSLGHVTVMFRTPQGHFHQRRFDSSNTVQVLLDFMTTIGYHQSLYTLITAYPRRSLDGVTEKTLAEANISGRVTFNVDRRDTDIQS